MADQLSKSAEKQDEVAKGPRTAEKPGRGIEIKEASKEFVEGVSEVVEATEFVEGKVGERAGEGKKGAPSGRSGGSSSQIEKDQSPPTIEIMRIQVSTQVEKEIRVLAREARYLSKRRKFNPAKLNGVVAKIRELRDILANLAYATAETLKGWWMKYVKGITI